MTKPITMALSDLASSSTFVAGRESAEIDNATDYSKSELWVTYRCSTANGLFEGSFKAEWDENGQLIFPEDFPKLGYKA